MEVEQCVANALSVERLRERFDPSKSTLNEFHRGASGPAKQHQLTEQIQNDEHKATQT